MAYLEAAMAAYEAASQYYKDQEEAAFKDDVLGRLGKIEQNTVELLKLVKDILLWTEDSLRLAVLHEASTGIGGARDRIAELVVGLGETKEIDDRTKDQLVDFQVKLADWCQVLRREGGYAVYPTVAVGVALMLIIHGQENLLSRRTLVATLRPNLDYFRAALEVKYYPKERDRRLGYLYYLALETIGQYPAFISKAASATSVGNESVFVTGSPSSSIDDGGWYAGLKGSWETGLVMSSHDGYPAGGIFGPRRIQPIPNFIPAPDTAVLKPIDFAPWLNCGGASDGRMRGYQIIGDLNGMISQAAWAKQSLDEIGRHCGNLQTIVRELEPIVEEQIAIAAGSVPISSREFEPAFP